MTGSTSWTRFLKKYGGEGKSREQLVREYRKSEAYKKNKCKREGKEYNNDTKRCNKKKSTRKKSTRKKKKVISGLFSKETDCNLIKNKMYKNGKCVDFISPFDDDELLDVSELIDSIVEASKEADKEEEEKVDEIVCNCKSRYNKAQIKNMIEKEVENLTALLDQNNNAPCF